jgi:hypothetical protein
MALLAACGQSLGPVDPASVPARLPFAFAGQSAYVGIAGRPGNKLVLNPGSESLALEAVGWRREDQTTCLVRVFKRDPARPSIKDVDVSDTCDDLKGRQREYLKVGVENHPAAERIGFIAAVRTCFPKSGERVAGIEVATKWFNPNGSVEANAEGPSDQFQASYSDCEQWSGWAECPPGQVANGLRTHYDETSEGRTLVGLELRCRAYVVTSGVASG